MNLLDRAIAYVSPTTAARRLKARMAIELAGGGYNGASFSRPALTNWHTRASDADADASLDLPTLRSRSRDLVRNAPLAGGALNTMVTNVVGTGLSLQPKPDAAFLGLTDEEATAWADAAQREFNLFAEDKACDITRKQNFYGLQGVAFRSAMESGDAFAVLPDRPLPGVVYSLAVQLIEADRICNPDQKPDSANLIGGVEMDTAGAAVAVHICNQHPGSPVRRASLKWEPRPMEIAIGNYRRPAVLHLHDRRRPGETRGIPILAPVIEPLKQLARYTEAELQAAVVSGMFAVFVKMESGAFQEMFDQDGKTEYLKTSMAWDGTLGAADLNGGGKAVNLLPGEEMGSINPGRPNALFDPFVQAILRQVGAVLEIPFEILIKHFTASYSAARAAMLDAWRVFRNRRDWLATYFCQPIYEVLLAEAVAKGRIAAPGFFADPAIRKAWCKALWVGDGPGSIDPVKDVTAAEGRIKLGISTRAKESIEYDGVDWRVKHKQLVEEEERRREDGLGPTVPMPSSPSAPGPEAQPQDDPPDPSLPND